MIAKIKFLNCFQLQIPFRMNYEKINVLKFQNGKLIVVGTLLLWQIVLKIIILRRCKYILSFSYFIILFSYCLFNLI